MPATSAAPVTPGIVPKVALTTARLAHKPFEVPAKLTIGAVTWGNAAHFLSQESAKTAKAVLDGLGARRGAQLITKLIDRVDAGTVKSAARANMVTKVTYEPVSMGAMLVGDGVTNPLVSFYAKRAGFNPADPAVLAAIRKEKGYPVAPPPGEGGDQQGGQGVAPSGPAPSGPAPTDDGSGQPKPTDDGGQPKPTEDGGQPKPTDDGSGGQPTAAPTGDPAANPGVAGDGGQQAPPPTG